MAVGNWADWQVTLLADSLGVKKPKREWFKGEQNSYATSLRSWSHITGKILTELKLEERQMILFIYHLGLEHVGVDTFEITDDVRSDYKPSEEYTKL